MKNIRHSKSREMQWNWPAMNSTRSRWHFFISTMVLFGLMIGCDNAVKKSPTNSSQPSMTEQPKSDHDHTSKHGGHLVHLSPSGAHAEWTHTEDGTITVILEETVSNGGKIESVEIILNVQGNPPKTHKLSAAAADDHRIEGAIFTIKDPALLMGLEVKEGVKVELVAKTSAGEQRAVLEHHEEHEGHKH